MVDPQPLGAGHCTDSLPMRGPGVRPALSHWHSTTMTRGAHRNPGEGTLVAFLCFQYKPVNGLSRPAPDSIEQ